MKQTNRLIRVVAVIAICVSLCAVTAYADSAQDYINTFKGNINGVIVTFQNIAKPLAVLGLAACALGFFLGSQKEAEASKQRAVYILLAIAAILFLPIVVKTALSFAEVHAWQPPHSETMFH